MKLVKVRDLGQRPASHLSVIVQFLFNSNMPGEFQPGKYYEKGSTVYTISEDGLSIKLWKCNISGAYANTHEPFWTEYSLDTYMDEYFKAIIKAIYDPHPQMYNLISTVGSSIVPRYNEAIQTICHTPSYLDVYYDGLYMNDSKYEIIDGEIKSLEMPDESKIIIDHYTACDPASRLIRRVNYTLTKGTDDLELPMDKIKLFVSYAYELYVNGLFINPELYEEYIDDNGKIFIKPTSPDFVLNEGDVCDINFMVSVSDNMIIGHSVLSKVIEKDMDSYDIDISDSKYINVYQTMTIFIDGKRVDSSMFHYSKGFLNVKEKENYLKKGSTITVSVMSYMENVFVYDEDKNERRYKTESIYTVENNTRLVPIPFLDFDEDIDDFLTFNENGVNISTAKWFIDNNYMRYYPHDQGVYDGDTVNFKMIDRNKNTIMRNFILTAEEIDQCEFTLPFTDSDYVFYMLFYSNGCYLSPNEYTIEGDKLILTHDMALDVNDRLELVAFDYPDEVGSTVMEYKRYFVNAEKVNSFDLDFVFDKSVTSLLLFANTGLYIGEKFYEISDDNILTIKGEEVYQGGWLDIIMVQSTEALTSVDDIKALL